MNETMRGELDIDDLAGLRSFVLAGRADFTLENQETSGRFTFKVCAPSKETEAGGLVIDHDANVRFVKVLTGPDNGSDYTFLGTIFLGTGDFRVSGKSRIPAGAPSAKAWAWFWGRVSKNVALPACLSVWHEGRCARCGRKLTVPESISSGYGPECRAKAA